jgi:putative transposase
MDDALATFIHQARDAREYARAVAVQMTQHGIAPRVIQDTLQVSAPFISKWKRIYAETGADGLRLRYQGGISRLSEAARATTLQWLQAQKHASLLVLQTYLKETFGVEYRSPQSYYTLMHAAGLRWKKAQATNPKKEAPIIAAKREMITTYVETYRDELVSGERVLLFFDECFLHWGDVCGYNWEKSNERLVIPVGNILERQAFYGALDARTGEMHLMPYPTAEQAATTDFLSEVRYRYPEKKLTICWDNASWHQGPELRAYLAKVNDHLPPDEWPLTLINFAPHDPTQNPIEEVWRQGKLAIQQLRLAATHFREVITAFEAQVERKIFAFPKRQMYGDLQIV